MTWGIIFFFAGHVGRRAIYIHRSILKSILAEPVTNLALAQLGLAWPSWQANLSANIWFRYDKRKMKEILNDACLLTLRFTECSDRQF